MKKRADLLRLVNEIEEMLREEIDVDILYHFLFQCAKELRVRPAQLTITVTCDGVVVNETNILFYHIPHTETRTETHTERSSDADYEELILALQENGII